MNERKEHLQEGYAALRRQVAVILEGKAVCLGQDGVADLGFGWSGLAARLLLCLPQLLHLLCLHLLQ